MFKGLPSTGEITQAPGLAFQSISEKSEDWNAVVQGLHTSTIRTMLSCLDPAGNLI